MVISKKARWLPVHRRQLAVYQGTRIFFSILLLFPRLLVPEIENNFSRTQFAITKLLIPLWTVSYGIFKKEQFYWNRKRTLIQLAMGLLEGCQHTSKFSVLEQLSSNLSIGKLPLPPYPAKAAILGDVSSIRCRKIFQLLFTSLSDSV